MSLSQRVVIQQRAEDDLYEAYLFAAKLAPQTARRWLERFLAASDRLANQPERYPLAAENGKVSRELRQMLFGRRPHVFRVLFTIDGDLIRVLRVRRGSRRLAVSWTNSSSASKNRPASMA